MVAYDSASQIFRVASSTLYHTVIRAHPHLTRILVHLRSLLSYLSFRKLPPLAVSSGSLPAAALLYLAGTVKTSFFNKWYFFLCMLCPCTTEDMHLVMSSLPVSLSSRQREISGTLKSESKPFCHLLQISSQVLGKYTCMLFTSTCCTFTGLWRDTQNHVCRILCGLHHCG